MQFESKCKIYLLRNKCNNKIYIGQTWYTCQERMGKNGVNYCHSTYLYAAIQKYGVDNFEYTILAETNNQKHADLLEDYYIEYYNSRDPNIGYNLKGGGSIGKHSEETKAKISKKLIGREVSEQTRQKISKIHSGLPKPLHTEEWKQANSAFIKRRHQEYGHPMKGRHHTEISKNKMRVALSGRKQSLETIEKRRKSLMVSQELQNKIIAAYLEGKTINEIKELFNISNNSKIYRILKLNNIKKLNNFSKWSGKKHTDETKNKMRQSRYKYLQSKKFKE